MGIDRKRIKLAKLWSFLPLKIMVWAFIGLVIGYGFTTWLAPESALKTLILSVLSWGISTVSGAGVFSATLKYFQFSDIYREEISEVVKDELRRASIRDSIEDSFPTVSERAVAHFQTLLNSAIRHPIHFEQLDLDIRARLRENILELDIDIKLKYINNVKEPFKEQNKEVFRHYRLTSQPDLDPFELKSIKKVYFDDNKYHEVKFDVNKTEILTKNESGSLTLVDYTIRYEFEKGLVSNSSRHMVVRQELDVDPVYSLDWIHPVAQLNVKLTTSAPELGFDILGGSSRILAIDRSQGRMSLSNIEGTILLPSERISIVFWRKNLTL